jgi:hypothetical protein
MEAFLAPSPPKARAAGAARAGAEGVGRSSTEPRSGSGQRGQQRPQKGSGSGQAAVAKKQQRRKVAARFVDAGGESDGEDPTSSDSQDSFLASDGDVESGSGSEGQQGEGPGGPEGSPAPLAGNACGRCTIEEAAEVEVVMLSSSSDSEGGRPAAPAAQSAGPGAAATTRKRQLVDWSESDSDSEEQAGGGFGGSGNVGAGPLAATSANPSLGDCGSGGSLVMPSTGMAVPPLSTRQVDPGTTGERAVMARSG